MLEVLKPPYMARKLYLAWDQKIWDILPTKLKNCVSYIIQKEWTPTNCPYRLPKMYVQNIGFLQVIYTDVFVL